MKNFIMMATLLILSGLSTHAQAGTALTDDMTKKYFDNCVVGAQKEATMTPDNQNKFCACTAMNMQKSMTQEDVAALSSRGDTQRNAVNIMLIKVNGPCLQYPTHDLLNNKCMTDLGKADVCSCVANKMAFFMKDISGRMLPKLLAENPNLFDTQTPILESPEFVETERKIVLACATNPHHN